MYDIICVVKIKRLTIHSRILVLSGMAEDAAVREANYICLKITKHPSKSVILPWKVIQVQDTLTFNQIPGLLDSDPDNFVGEQIETPKVNDNVNGASQKLVTKYFCAKTPNEKGLEVSPELLVSKTCSLFGNFIHVSFEIIEIDLPSSSQVKDNAFAKMLAASAKQFQTPRLYPKQFDLAATENIDSDIARVKSARNRGDKRLYNDLVNLLKNESAYFSCEKSLQTGRKFLRIWCDTVFLILPQVEKFNHEGIKFTKLFMDSFFLDPHDLSSQTYNNPVKSKHGIPVLSRERLQTQTNLLYDSLSQPFMILDRFKNIRQEIKSLCESCSRYITALERANERMKKCQASENASSDSFHSVIKPLSANYIRSVSVIQKYRNLEESLVGCYESLFLNDFTPSDKKERYKYLDQISLPFPTEMVWFTDGQQKLWFIWRIPTQVSERDMNKSIKIMKNLESENPKFYSRAMQKKFSEKYSLLLRQNGCQAGLLPSILREIYQDLTGDISKAPSKITKSVRTRIRTIIDSSDPSLIADLRNFNTGPPRKYDQFFDAVKRYIEENSLQAEHERRHDTISRLAIAISVRDLIEQVKKTLPPDSEIPIPSASYLRLQFWPKNPTHKSALHYTGLFDLKFKIQTRQLRSDHEDAHYAAALYKYLRSYAVNFSDYCTFACIDDKHNVKVGEPGLPVASADRGKQVIVGQSQFSAADHDFVKCKIVPSAVLVCSIPETIEGSFYQGQLAVSLKDQVFEPSSPMRHSTELIKILTSQNKEKNPVLLLYSDGGPDHRIVYLEVQLALLALFIFLDLDCLHAVRTAPYQSFHNPVERCMSTLNLGLQFVSLARAKMDDDTEKILNKCSSIQSIREKPEIKLKFIESITPAIETLEQVMARLQYDSKQVFVSKAATNQEIKQLKNKLLVIDPTIDIEKKILKKDLKNYPDLENFLDSHTIKKHYIFSIIKCQSNSCGYCSVHPIKSDLPPSVLHPLPDPVPAEDGQHYKPFSELFSKVKTSEKYRPSLDSKAAKRKRVYFSIE